VKKRRYIRPAVNEVVIDNTISIQMYSPPDPPDPDDRTGGKKGTDTPFQSPFGDKPFG
jgi:hypothetical protein